MMDRMKSRAVKSRKGKNRPGVTVNSTAPKLVLWLAPGLIFLLTFLAFLPSLQNGFVDWDDTGMLLENERYRGFGWTQLRWMFTAYHMGHYHPLTWVTLSVDYLLWRMEPFGYHLTNLLLHAANAVLFYFLTLRLLSLVLLSSHQAGDLARRMAAGFAALIFAAHPLRVESVAWATERRDVLSGFFFLWSLLCYLRANEVAVTGSTRLRWLVAAAVVYGLSLLSKAVGITLPLILLVLDVYPLRRLRGGPGKWLGPDARRVWWEKIPFLLLAVAFGIIALLAQREFGALKPLERYGAAQRIAQTFYGIVFYLWKTVLPAGLSPIYEIPADFDALAWRFILSAVVALAISGCLVAMRRRWPAGLVVWICYLVVLSPVLGIAQSGPQFVADRYSYLSCLGWAVLAGAGLLCVWQASSGAELPRGKFFLVSGVATVTLLGLGGLTWRQAQVWRDSETLWRHVLATGQESKFAHNNLGLIQASRGDSVKGVEHFRRALEIDPAYANAHYNLGNVLSERAELDSAIRHFRRAIQIDPVHVNAYNNLGIALAKQGELEEAIRHFRRAIEIDPAYINAHNNLGIALASRGELDEAVQHFRRALQISPTDLDAHNNLAKIFAGRGEMEEAIRFFQRVVELSPDRSEAHFNLAKALFKQGNFKEATDHFRQALRLKPDFAEAHESLARGLAAQGKRDEAVQHYQEALRIMKSHRQQAEENRQ
jgi:tetratricopeptide (TPR) repeat protein